VYSLPPGSTITNGDTSDSSDLNTPLADLEADMNIPRPVVAGGTGASSAAAALVNLGLTATAAELNYTDGVTSPIQTQIDALTSGKQAAGATLTSLEGLSLAAGDGLYATAADTLARLAAGVAGQALTMNAGSTAPEWGSSVRPQTEIVASSQTAMLFSSIPSWVKRVTVVLGSLSTNGTSEVIVRLGDSGGVEATGYVGTTSFFSSTAFSAVSLSTGFLVSFGSGDTAAATRSGSLVLTKGPGNAWFCSGTAGLENDTFTSIINGVTNLDSDLTQIQITTVGGANTFDAGLVMVVWE